MNDHTDRHLNDNSEATHGIPHNRRQDNIDLLLEAVARPEHFSDEQLNAILSDPEAREIYALMSKTADSLSQTPNFDIDAEWQRFAETNRLLPEPGHGIIHSDPNPDIIFSKPEARGLRRLFPYLSRHAAAVIGILIIASAAVIAATMGIRNASGRRVPSPVASAETESLTTNAPLAPTDTVPETVMPAPAPEIITFKEENLENIIEAICKYYGATAKFTSGPAKEIQLYYKWDQSLPLQDVADELNSFEQISILLSDSVLYIN